jgi:WD40 repeat protein
MKKESFPFQLLKRGEMSLVSERILTHPKASSRDGTIKLWDCSTQQCISNLVDGGLGSINQISTEKNQDLGSTTKTTDEREYGTDYHLVSFVSESGTFKVLDVRSRKEIISMKFKDPLESCSLTDSNVFLGSNSGDLYRMDLRNTKEVDYFKRDSSPILKMIPLNKVNENKINGLVISLDMFRRRFCSLVGFRKDGDFNESNRLQFRSNL